MDEDAMDEDAMNESSEVARDDAGGWGDGSDPGADLEAGREAVIDDDEADAAGSGHPAVDAAVRAVANASGLPVGEQLAAYEGAHETLREVLASIED